MPHIFVVDDDPNIRELVTGFLRAEGFTVTTAVDGLDALTPMEQHKADLVLLDVMMPNMDGWELCRTLRASSPSRHWRALGSLKRSGATILRATNGRSLCTSTGSCKDVKRSPSPTA